MRSRSSATLGISLLLVLITMAALLTAPPVQQIRDALYWAKEVETGTNLYAILNPHHLMYLPAVWALFATLSSLCPSCGVIEAAQLIGLISSAVAAIALFVLARHLAGSAFVATALALVLIFSRTFWIYSMQVSPYVPMVAALALFALVIVVRGDSLQNDKWSMLLASAAFALAVLLHQAAVLIGFALALYLFVSRSWRDAWRALLWFGICSGSIVLASYLVAFHALYGIGDLSYPAFAKYLTRYASTDNPCCATFRNYSLQGITDLMEGHFEAFMAPPWSLKLQAIYAYGAGVVLLVGWNIHRAIVRDRTAVRAFFVSWLVINLLLILWAYPYGGVPPMLNVVPLLALVAMAIGDLLARIRVRRHARMTGIALGTALLAFAVQLGARNFEDGIGPLHASRGKKYYKAVLLAATAPKQCTVAEGDQEVLMNLYFYFDRAGLDVWDLLMWFHFGSGKKVPFTWDSFRFSNHACLVIEEKYLAPTMPIQLRVAGDDAPDRWYSYIEWLLGFGYENGRITSTRCMSRVVDSGGSRYLVIDTRKRCDAAGLEAAIAQLDVLLGATNGQEGRAVFSDWLSRHRALVPGFRQRAIRDALG